MNMPDHHALETAVQAMLPAESLVCGLSLNWLFSF